MVSRESECVFRCELVPPKGFQQYAYLLVLLFCCSLFSLDILIHLQNTTDTEFYIRSPAKLTSSKLIIHGKPLEPTTHFTFEEFNLNDIAVGVVTGGKSSM